MTLQLHEVSRRFGTKQAVDGVSLTFKAGVTGLLGPNGAGKSTLMRMLATVEKPTGGKILLNGVDIGKKPNEMRRCLGYLPQDFGVYPNLNAVEFLQYMAAMKGMTSGSAKKRIDELLELLHLTDAKKRLLGGYSGGMKQRVGIASALLADPKVLIVDEPTAGLDPEERIGFRNLLAGLAADRIIILSTHIVSDIESIAPTIALISGGRLMLHASPEQLIERAEGKVWSLVTSAGQLAELQQRFAIGSAIQKADGVHVRVLCAKQPALSARPERPTLEDAYLCLTRKV